MKIRFSRFFICAFGLTALAASHAETKVTIATGPTGGVYHPLGCAVAEIYRASIPGVVAKCESSAGSAENINSIATGKVQVAFTQADTAWDGYKGYGKFNGSQPIRAVAVLYPNNLHVVVRGDSGIVKAADLRGRSVSMGAKGSGTEIWGTRLLTAIWPDPDQAIVPSAMSLTESAAALKAGSIDAFVWSGGVPTKAIADLAKDRKIRLLDTAFAVPKMLRTYGPVYTDGEIAADTYSGVGGATRVAQVWNLLIVNADADEKLVYEMTKVLFEHKADLVAQQSEVRHLELLNQARTSPIPFHPGTKRYFKEKGIRILR